MASGVSVSDECKDAFDMVKQAKKHRYVIFFIKDERTIEIEKCGERGATYNDYVEDIQRAGKGQCRYGLFDYEYTHKIQGAEPSKKEKMFLMLWAPEEAHVKSKMLYSSSFDAFKKALLGVMKYIEATDASDLAQQEVEAKLRAGDRS